MLFDDSKCYVMLCHVLSNHDLLDCHHHNHLYLMYGLFVNIIEYKIFLFSFLLLVFVRSVEAKDKTEDRTKDRIGDITKGRAKNRVQEDDM